VVRLLLLVHDPIKYMEVVNRVSADELPICEAEEDQFGISHQDLGFQH
jgi:hypothetical protein